MRGASFLKKPLPSTIESAEQSLRATKNNDQLAAAWFANCDRFEGEARERLQEVYTEMLFKHGALQG